VTGSVRPPLLHCIATLGGGGAERQIAYLAAGLSGLGWPVHVAYVEGGSNLPRLEASGAVLHRLEASGHHDPRLLARLVRLVRDVHPGLAQTWLLQMDVLGGLAARITGVPWVLAERSSAENHPPGWKTAARAWLARGARLVVANSLRGDAYWRARLPTRVPRRVVPNAVPVSEIAAAPAAESRETIVAVGRLDAGKNLEPLVDAFALVAASRPAVRFVLLGEGPLRATLAERVRRLDLVRRVELAGYVDDVWARLRGARGLVSASRYEGQPNAVLEAMAAGCPVVVADIPAHREILDDESALFVDGASPQAIAGTLVRLLDDPAAAAHRAAAARARVAEWSPERIAQQWDALYLEALVTGSPAGR
jgi:glycosyltransferase involved in cell wall biosynthesis